MMAITHELKTPIAVAKLNLETLLMRKLDEEKAAEIITACIAGNEQAECALQQHAHFITDRSPAVTASQTRISTSANSLVIVYRIS